MCVVWCAVSDAVSACSPSLLVGSVAERFPSIEQRNLLSALAFSRAPVSGGVGGGAVAAAARVGKGASVVDVPVVLQQFPALGRGGGPDSVHRQCSCLQLCYRGWYPQCRLCGVSAGAVLERVDTENASDDFVCAAEEPGDNGLSWMRT